MNLNKISPRSRSRSEPTLLEHKINYNRNINRDIYRDCDTHISISRARSEYRSEYRSETRPRFNGHETASIIIVGRSDEFTELCENYNFGNKNNLEEDHPYEIRSLSLELVKEFPNAKKHIKLSKFITNDMEEKAKAQSKYYKFGHDFVFEYCIENKVFDTCAHGLNFLCEIVVPRVGFEQYKNIDVTTVTEKTKVIDTDILSTGIRGVQEEIGIDLTTAFGKKILSPMYQNEFRKLHSPHLPYNFTIGTRGHLTECIIVCAYQEDIIECQMVTKDELMDIHFNRLANSTISILDD